MATLLEECIEALGEDILVIEDSKVVNELFQTMSNSYVFTSWGRIEWESIKEHETFFYLSELVQYCNENQLLDKEFYILWDQITLPSIKTNLENIFNNLDDVTATSANIWLFNLETNSVVEFYHGDENVQVSIKR